MNEATIPFQSSQFERTLAFVALFHQLVILDGPKAVKIPFKCILKMAPSETALMARRHFRDRFPLSQQALFPSEPLVSKYASDFAHHSNHQSCERAAAVCHWMKPLSNGEPR